MILGEDEEGEEEQDEAQSYYDENGNKIEGTYEEGEAEYGEEGQDGQQQYGDEKDYGN